MVAGALDMKFCNGYLRTMSYESCCAALDALVTLAANNKQRTALQRVRKGWIGVDWGSTAVNAATAAYRNGPVSWDMKRVLHAMLPLMNWPDFIFDIQLE